MRQRIFITMLLGCVTLIVFVSCKKEKTPTNSNPNQVPSDVARISGSVNDAAGNPLSDVFLHLVYPEAAPAQKADFPLVPTSALFSSGSEVLYTECGGSVPLSDGVMVKLFWDQNSNGVDDSDLPPPLCNNPPECRTGPTFTVNLTELAINSATQGLEPGQFFSEQAFHTIGDMLRPNRFYARIYCADGQPLYTSQVLDLPGGPSTNVLHFTCTPCTGAPVVPQWLLNPSYPNPATDSLTLSFGLQQAASAVVTLRGHARGSVDTLIHGMLPSGPRRQRVALRTAGTGTIANGLYAVRFQASTFDQQHDILKNDTAIVRLQNTEAATTTAGDGSFTLDAPAGIHLVRRNEQGDSLGTTSLTRLRVLAIHVGHITADTVFSISGGQSYGVNLVLRTP